VYCCPPGFHLTHTPSYIHSSTQGTRGSHHVATVPVPSVLSPSAPQTLGVLRTASLVPCTAIPWVWRAPLSWYRGRTACCRVIRNNTPWERWQVHHGTSFPTVYVLDKVPFLGTYVPSTKPGWRAPAMPP
jgi:hypothetical protein